VREHEQSKQEQQFTLHKADDACTGTTAGRELQIVKADLNVVLERKINDNADEILCSAHQA
jgi:hypothetical protein